MSCPGIRCLGHTPSYSSTSRPAFRTRTSPSLLNFMGYSMVIPFISTTYCFIPSISHARNSRDTHKSLNYSVNSHWIEKLSVPWREHRCCHGSPSCLRESRKFLVKGCNSRNELHGGVTACDIFCILFSKQRKKEHFAKRVSRYDTLCICMQVCEWNVYDVNTLWTSITSDTWMIINASTCTKERVGTSGHSIFLEWGCSFIVTLKMILTAVTNSRFAVALSSATSHNSPVIVSGGPVWLKEMFSAGCSFTGRAAFAAKSSLHLPTWWKFMMNYSCKSQRGEKGNATHQEWSNHISCITMCRENILGQEKGRPAGVYGTKAFRWPLQSGLGWTLANGDCCFGSQSEEPCCIAALAA